MITKVNAYQSSDGTAHSSLEEAQKFEIFNILKSGGKWADEVLDEVADAIMDNAEAIVDILTTTPSSKPKARKINGGTKKRKKAETEALPFSDPNKAA